MAILFSVDDIGARAAELNTSAQYCIQEQDLNPQSFSLTAGPVPLDRRRQALI